MLIFFHSDGQNSRGSAADFASVLLELTDATDDHPDVACANEDGIMLSVLGVNDTLVILEDAEADSIPVMHVAGLTYPQVIELAEALESGSVPGVLGAANWEPGPGSS